MSDDLDENPLRTLQMNQFKDRMNSIREGFGLLEKADVNTLQEDDFKRYFLDYFAGEDITNNKRILEVWFTIAGTNYSPVNIVDNAGRFIIQVPPIHDKSIITPILDRKVDLAYTFNEAEQKGAISPNAASNIINTGLGERYNSLIGEGSGELKEKWLALFKHYGKTPKGADAKTNSSTNDDEFVW